MAEVQLTPTQLAAEKWLPIPGWEGAYEVSDMGRVRSLDRIIVCKNGVRKPRKGRILRPAPNYGGYLGVALCAYGKQVTRHIHVLMMEAFVGPRPEGMDICHKDDDPTGNRLDNLRYGTRAENIHDMIRNGGNHNMSKTHCPRGHDFVEKNLTADSRRNGYRTCLACSRTKAYMQRHPEMKPDFKIISDQYYEAILRDAPAA